jgi:SWI/SNF-related matrix-associated actin-dependent regulator 1 of chromatin subfamily A
MDRLPLDWTGPKDVNTRNGARVLRKAPANETFWALWKSDKEALKALGYSVSRNDKGAWEVCHWGLPDGKTQEQAAVDTNEAIQASRAVSAEIDIPLSDRARALGHDYLPFQRAGVAFCSSRPATLLGDDMGVGKTIQIIGLMNKNDAGVALVVCPQGMLYTWAKELFVWLVKPLPITVVTAGKAVKLSEAGGFEGINDQVTLTDKFPRKPRGVVVINWDILHKYETELRATNWDVVAFDESQYGKNGKARRTEYAFGRKDQKATEKRKGKKAIAPIPGKVRICASGTPMKNRPVELFTQLHYLDPVAWPNFFTYGKRYCAAHQNGFGWDFKGSSNLDELNLRLRSSIMIRRMKSEVLTDLPAKSRQVISLPGNGHSQLMQQEITAYEAYEAARVANDFTRMGIAGGELAKIRLQLGLDKVPVVLSHLEEVEQKTVIFCRHKEVQKQLAEALKDKGVVIFNGDMSPTAKEEAKVSFQNDDAIQYFIGTITSCGVGLTLTASNYCVFAELEWSPADLNQAEDRLNRKGQKNAVTVHHLVFDGSLDERMLVGIMKKQRVLDAGLDNEVEAQAPAALVLPEPKLAPTTGSRRQDMKTEGKPLSPITDEAWEKAKKAAEADRLPEETVKALHRAIQVVAGMCDGALQRDGHGFNGTDARFGASLARAPFLSQGQARSALKMMKKYRRQMGDELHSSIYGAQ